MPHSNTANAAADCPQCRAAMMHVAITPHPVARTMQRSIYMCAPCNRTRIYMLQTPVLNLSTVEPQSQFGTA